LGRAGDGKGEVKKEERGGVLEGKEGRGEEQRDGKWKEKRRIFAPAICKSFQRHWIVHARFCIGMGTSGPIDRVNERTQSSGTKDIDIHTLS